jgi:hypothetical protein
MPVYWKVPLRTVAVAATAVGMRTSSVGTPAAAAAAAAVWLPSLEDMVYLTVVAAAASMTHRRYFQRRRLLAVDLQVLVLVSTRRVH